jgi:dihydroorotate dehydrogenase (subfamily 1) family protein
MNLSVNIAGITLKNPIVTASGTCGFGDEYTPFYKSSDLGAIAVKGLTLAPRLGNPVIRIAEVSSGILNSIGLQNPGVHVFMEKELPRLKREGVTVIANISGNSISDYCEMAQILSNTAVDMIEMNISCPNVKEGGVAFGVKPKTVAEITREVRKYCKKPLIVKLSPNVADIAQNALAAESEGADVLSLINTLIGMKIDIHTRRPVLHNNIGGLSGPCVKPVAVRMVWQVANSVNIPIIGMGGIETGEDAVEFLLAGASAVAIGTAAFTNPYAPITVLQGIEQYMKENGIDDVNDLVGKVQSY